jgi:hypothetical protein
MGKGNLQRMAGENIVALCDVEWGKNRRTNVADVFALYPAAKKYYDWRQMYDEMGKSIDAVMCATADHTHAIVFGTCHYSEQTCILSETADPQCLRITSPDKAGCRIQSCHPDGEPGFFSRGVKLICEWIWNGEIGEVSRNRSLYKPADLAAGINCSDRSSACARNTEMGSLYWSGKIPSL